MGLLDNPQDAALMQLGLGLLSAGAPSRTPVSLGQAIGSAGSDALQAYRQREADLQRNKMAEMQMQEMQAKIEEAKRQRAMQEMIRGAAKDSYLTPQQQAIGVGGPTPGAAAMIPNLQPKFDQKAFLGKLYGIDPLMAMYMQDKMAPKPIKLGAEESLIDPTTYKPIATGMGKNEIKDGYLVKDANGVWGVDKTLYEAKKGLRPVTQIDNKIINTAETEQAKEWGKKLGELRSSIATSAFNAPSQMAKLDRMEELLVNVNGGGVLAPTGLELASALKSVGFDIDQNLANKEAAQALGREMAGALRQLGTGPMTDKDFDNFLKQIPDLSKTAAGRKQIMATMRAAHKRAIAVNKLASDYARSKGGGLDDGFVDVLSKFYADNPVVPAGIATDIRAQADAILKGQ